MTTRALRRHHTERLKRKRAGYFFGKAGVKVFHTPALCSCPMCGNPRKWFGERTIQERRLFQDLLL